jgi:hypothetical protein
MFVLFLYLVLGLLNKHVDKLETKSIRVVINQHSKCAACIIKIFLHSKAAGYSEILVASYRTVRRHIKEDHILQ